MSRSHHLAVGHRIAAISFSAGVLDCSCGESVSVEGQPLRHERLAFEQRLSEAFTAHRRDVGAPPLHHRNFAYGGGQTFNGPVSPFSGRKPA